MCSKNSSKRMDESMQHIVGHRIVNSDNKSALTSWFAFLPTLVSLHVQRTIDNYL
jgi:hypothetical protein